MTIGLSIVPDGMFPCWTEWTTSSSNVLSSYPPPQDIDGTSLMLVDCTGFNIIYEYV